MSQLTLTESIKKWQKSKKNVFCWQKFLEEWHLKFVFHRNEIGYKPILWKCFVKNCWAKQLIQSSDFCVSWFLHVWAILLSRNSMCKLPLRICCVCIVLLYSLICLTIPLLFFYIIFVFEPSNMCVINTNFIPLYYAAIWENQFCKVMVKFRRTCCYSLILRSSNLWSRNPTLLGTSRPGKFPKRGKVWKLNNP